MQIVILLTKIRLFDKLTMNCEIASIHSPYCILLPRWGANPSPHATQGVAQNYVEVGLLVRGGEVGVVFE